MIKRLTIAIAAILSMSPVAKANVVEDYIYSNPVLEAVHNSGTTIKFTSDRCETGKIYGSYNSTTDTMVLCLKNHPNLAELGDTIRHETIHIIQMCHGGPILGIKKLTEFAKPTDWSFIAQYPTSVHHIELEANIGARTLTDAQVVSNFMKACNQ